MTMGSGPHPSIMRHQWSAQVEERLRHRASGTLRLVGRMAQAGLALAEPRALRSTPLTLGKAVPMMRDIAARPKSGGRGRRSD
jgi:hypothetical protein